eukprot:1695531-Pyramimonas_sp.AAC.1
MLLSNLPHTRVDVRCEHLSVGLGAAALHGDKPQAERDAAIAAFRRGAVSVLIATDVAARGLDIAGIYNTPSTFTRGA